MYGPPDSLSVEQRDEVSRAIMSPDARLAAPTPLNPLSRVALIIPGDTDPVHSPPYKSGGTASLGAPVGTPAYVRNQAAKESARILAVLPKLQCLAASSTQCASLLLRVCLTNSSLHPAKATAAPAVILESIARPLDEGIAKFVCDTIAPGIALSATTTDLLHLPLRMGGLGLTPAANLVTAQFLAGFLRAATFIQGTMPQGHITLTWLANIFQHPESSDYANAVHAAASDFALLFRSINGREPTMELDHFRSFAPRDLIAISDVIISLTRSLLATQSQRRLVPTLSMQQAASYRSSCAPGASAALAALPTIPQLTIPNPAFQVIFARRLLSTNILGATLSTEICPGQGCGAPLDDIHVSSCIHAAAFVTRGGFTHRHNECIGKEIKGALHYAGYACDAVEPKDNPVFQQQLVQAGVVFGTNRDGTTAYKGGDICVRDFQGPGQHLILDHVVTDERAAMHVVPPNVQEPPPPVAALEAAKKVRYGPGFYDLIGVGFQGVAIDLAGAMGPGLRDVLRRAFRSNVNTIDRAPLPGCNWTASTPLAYFSQRIVTVLQAYNASRLAALVVECARQRASIRAQLPAGRPVVIGRRLLENGGGFAPAGIG